MVFHFETKHDGSKQDSLAQLKGEEEILLFRERERKSKAADWRSRKEGKTGPMRIKRTDTREWKLVGRKRGPKEDKRRE